MPIPALYEKIKRGDIKVTKMSPPLHRFWASVTKDGSVHPVYGKCWVWIPPKSRGYGQFTVRGKVLRPHRYAYEVFVGPVGKDTLVMHKCDNRGCVNPRHLILGTHLDNQRDKVAKGRQAKGEGNGFAHLTTEQILEIRRRYKLKRGYHDPVNGQSGLARDFNISQTHVSDIVRRKFWRHV